MIHIQEALVSLKPSAVFTLHGNTYTGLVWLDAVQLKPTEAEVTAEMWRLTKAAAVAQTYSDVDAIYSAAVGNRESEYIQAEQDARAFKATGYTGIPSAYISGWATVKGFSNQVAADAIIAKADALHTAKLALRNARFISQAEMQAATTQQQLDTAVNTWNTTLININTSLGLVW